MRFLFKERSVNINRCTLCGLTPTKWWQPLYRIPPKGMKGTFYGAGAITGDQHQVLVVCRTCYKNLSCYNCNAKGAKPRTILKYKNDQHKNIIQIVCKRCYRRVYKEY